LGSVASNENCAYERNVQVEDAYPKSHLEYYFKKRTAGNSRLNRVSHKADAARDLADWHKDSSDVQKSWIVRYDRRMKDKLCILLASGTITERNLIAPEASGLCHLF